MVFFHSNLIVLNKEQGSTKTETTSERERKLRKYYLYTESNNSSMSIIRTGLDWIGPVLR